MSSGDRGNRVSGWGARLTYRPPVAMVMLLRGRQAGILGLTVSALGSGKPACTSVPTSLVGVGRESKTQTCFYLKFTIRSQRKNFLMRLLK